MRSNIDNRLLTPERLAFELPRFDQAVVSPSGREVMFRRLQVEAANKAQVANVWISKIDGTHARRYLEIPPGASSACWSPDGQLVAFVATEGDGKTEAIYVVSTHGASTPKPIATDLRNAAGVTWSPDGRRLAYTAIWDPDGDRPERSALVARRLDFKRDGSGFLGNARSHVFVVERSDGLARRVTTTAVEHGAPVWSPDGNKLAVDVFDWTKATVQVGIFDLQSGSIELLEPAAGGEDVVGTWAWSPDGSEGVFCGADPWSPQPEVYLRDLAGHATRRLTTGLHYLPEGRPAWVDRDRVVLHGYRAGRSCLVQIDVRTGRVTEIASWNAICQGFSPNAKARLAAHVRSSSTRGPDIWVVDLSNGVAGAVTTDGHRFAANSTIGITESRKLMRDDLVIDSLVTLPPNLDERRLYPVIVSVHGGPDWFWGNAFEPLHQLLATSGFIVLAPNPRGSATFGRDFVNRALGDWGKEPFRDIMATLEALLGRPYADPNRIGITGASYGGYMTALAIGQTPRFRAAVAAAVTFDMESQYGSADFDFAYGAYAWGGSPNRNREWYTLHSPSTYAHRVTTPTLIMHGERDQRCPLSQAEQMFHALKRAGCKTELVIYPDAGHSFVAIPQFRADYLRRTRDWFVEHLRPESAQG